MSVRGTYGERTQYRLCLGLFHWRSLFLSVFTVDLAVSSRISSFPQESRRQSPGWHSLDGILPIWAFRGCALVVRLAHPGWSPTHLVSRSSSPSQPRQELLCSAAPPGPPFLLDVVVYASCSLTSSGALGRMPWGTQGLFWVALNKGFSFRKEVRPWSRSC